MNWREDGLPPKKRSLSLQSGTGWRITVISTDSQTSRCPRAGLSRNRLTFVVFTLFESRLKIAIKIKPERFAAENNNENRYLECNAKRRCICDDKRCCQFSSRGSIKDEILEINTPKTYKRKWNSSIWNGMNACLRGPHAGQLCAHEI